ncbi:MAG: Trm112 family protein [Planctomycetes bacterium]|nr:Trm112 family protein [Planctomycetota bacterium]
MIDPELLATLCCPACRAPLTPKGPDRLLCGGPGCGLLYRIEDEIPILLVEEAIAPEDRPRGLDS